MKFPFTHSPCAINTSAEEGTFDLKTFSNKRRFRNKFKSKTKVQMANVNMVVKCENGS